MYKSLLIIVVVTTMIAISAFSPITTYAQKLPKDVFITQENIKIEQSLPGCTMAQLLPTINPNVTITCQKDIRFINDNLCTNQEYGPYIAACKYGSIQNFVDTYNHDGNLGE